MDNATFEKFYQALSQMKDIHTNEMDTLRLFRYDICLCAPGAHSNKKFDNKVLLLILTSLVKYNKKF